MSTNNKKQQAAPKTKIFVDENSSYERLGEVMRPQAKLIESVVKNKVQIHHAMEATNPETQIVIKPNQIFSSSPITPMGEDKLNMYLTLALHPKTNENTGHYIPSASGEKTEHFMDNIFNLYGAQLDQDEDLKQEILTKVGTDPDFLQAKMERPSTSSMSHIVVRNLITNVPIKDPRYQSEDKTKSPVIRTKLWVVPCKEEWRSPTNFLIPESDQVCFTSIFVPGKMRNTFVKANSMEALEPYMYRAGDSKLGKKHFRLMVQVEMMPPTVYWTAEKAKTSVTITLSKITILGKEIIERETLSSAEQLQLSSLAAQAASEMGFKFYDEDDDNNNDSNNNNNNGDHNGDYGGYAQNNGGGSEFPYEGGYPGGYSPPPAAYSDFEYGQPPPQQQQSVTRQLKPNATLPTQHKTVSVVVYPKQNGLSATSTNIPQVPENKQTQSTRDQANARTNSPIRLQQQQPQQQQLSSNVNLDADTDDFDGSFDQDANQSQFQGAGDDYDEPSQKHFLTTQGDEEGSEFGEEKVNAEEDSRKRKRPQHGSGSSSSHKKARTTTTTTPSTKRKGQ